MRGPGGEDRPPGTGDGRHLPSGDGNGPGGPRRSFTRIVAAVMAATLVLTGCTWFGDAEADPEADADGPIEPIFDGWGLRFDELCEVGACASDLIALPMRRFIDTAVDLPLPEPLGALTVERVWTGERTGLFGEGWETVWDIRLTDGRLTGPVPGRPLGDPVAGERLDLSSGLALRFDDTGRPIEVCAAEAICTAAGWADDGSSLTLTPSDAPEPWVRLDLTDGVTTTLTSDDGRRATYRYVDSRLQGVDAVVGTTTYSYDAQGRLVSVDAPGGRRTIEYAEPGVDGGDAPLQPTVSAVTDRDGVRWEVHSPADDTITLRSVAAEVTYRFDGDRLVEVDDAEAGVLLRRRFVDGRLVEEQRPVEGLVSMVLDDGRVRVVERLDDGAELVTLHTVDALGRLTATESAEGRREFSWTLEGRIAEVVTASGTTSFRYDERGLLAGTVDPDGYTITIERDDRGLPRSVGDGLTSTAFEHDEAGRVVLERSGERTLQARYDDTGRLVAIVDGLGTETLYGFDDSGRLSVVDSARERTLLRYDHTGNLDEASARRVGILDGVASARSGLAAPVRAEDGTLTISAEDGSSVTYDEWGRVLRVEANGVVTTRDYDADGRLIELVEPGRTTRLMYTPGGRIRSIDVDGVQLDVEWHGELMTALIEPDGTRVEYRYDEAGQLARIDVGPLRWEYTHDPAGNLTAIDGPAGRMEFDWDAAGRPEHTRLPSRETRTFEWDGRDLLAMIEPDGSTMELVRNADGRVVALMSEDGTLTIEHDDEGRVVGYRLPGGAVGEVDHEVSGDDSGDDSGVTRIRLEDHVEHWRTDPVTGLITEVLIGDGDGDQQRFGLEWLAPGLLAGVELDGASVLATVSDERGRITTVAMIDGNEEDLRASLTWDAYGISTAVIDGADLSIGRDGAGRVERIVAEDVDLRILRDDGAPSVIASPVAIQEFEFADGRVSGSSVRTDDGLARIDWDPTTGRPVTFSTPDGSGAFAYRDDRVMRISIGDDIREVTYAADGSPSAGGVAGDLLGDLFDDLGRFRGTSAVVDPGPIVPALALIPSEIGLEAPRVLTGDEVVRVALELSIPSIPLPLMAGGVDEAADRLIDVVLTLGATVDLPVAPGQSARTTLRPEGNDLAGLLLTSPHARVGDSLLDRLAGAPCLLCRVVDLGSAVVSGIGSAAVSAYRFVVDNPVTRALLTFGFVAATFVGIRFAAGLCPTLACRVAVVAGALVISELVLGTPSNLGELLYSVTVQPVIGLVRGVIELDAAAIVLSAAVLASLFTGGAFLRSPAARQRIDRAMCRADRVVCISGACYPQAAAHIRDAQRAGYGRIYTIDRGGAAARRSDNLRGFDRRAGFDRDEVPPALMVGRRPLASVRYIDPSQNRGAGAVIGQQTRALGDGTRVTLRAISRP